MASPRACSAVRWLSSAPYTVPDRRYGGTSIVTAIHEPSGISRLERLGKFANRLANHSLMCEYVDVWGSSLGMDEPAYDSKINKAASSQSAAVVAAGARARPLTFPPAPERQRRHRTAVAHRARTLRGAIARAAGDRRAVSHLEPQLGRRALAHGRARPG